MAFSFDMASRKKQTVDQKGEKRDSKGFAEMEAILTANSTKPQDVSEVRKDEIMNLYPSVSLAKSKKWKQEINILKGLKLTISHYRRNFK